MAIFKISIQQLIQQPAEYPVLDVRSPGEYKHAHLPGAYSLPLFSDEERKVVGTAYKQQGKQQAIKLGLACFGPKMVAMVEEAERIVSQHTGANRQDKVSRTVVVHCWRGGMRSAGVSWLLDLYGFNVYTLTGGYKSFRRWCVQQFEKAYPFSILGGFTGSGKTRILHALKARGQAVLDLESLAMHKGSVFGHLGQPMQPTQEMFENRLALALTDLEMESLIWLEDESQRIGSVNIPIVLYRHMQCRPVFFLDIPFEERLKHIIEGYGQFEKEKIADGIARIRKRLGGLETKTALAQLAEGDLAACFRILLRYYDKYYLKSLDKKQDPLARIRTLPCTNTDAVINADMLLSLR
jgi:tRNA 2-selenouridine synthase